MARTPPDWLLRFVIAGVIFDLAISLALAGFGLAINADRTRTDRVNVRSQCWDQLLAQAVRATVPTVPQHTLILEARHCASL